ncbi:MAG TPA: hypothetical protein VF199_03005 [Bacillales bacterium]
MYNIYEAEKLAEAKKAEMDCVSREGWKLNRTENRHRRFSLRQLFASESIGVMYCRECLDC